MFTVKYRESDALGGNEYLYSAETIEVVRRGAHFEDGIFLDPEPPIATASGDDRLVTRFAKHVIMFGGDQTSDATARCGGKVWVMNESGATVASYDL